VLDLGAGSGPSSLKESTPAPERREVLWSVGERAYRGDLYLPGEPVGAGLVLVPGLAPEGRDDRRLCERARHAGSRRRRRPPSERAA
jgi:hypothetical protein